MDEVRKESGACYRLLEGSEYGRFLSLGWSNKVDRCMEINYAGGCC